MRSLRKAEWTQSTALHTQMREHTPAVEYLVNHFEGPVASYPDSGRDDFIDRHMNRSVPNEYSVDMFVNEAKKGGSIWEPKSSGAAAVTASTTSSR